MLPSCQAAGAAPCHAEDLRGTCEGLEGIWVCSCSQLCPAWAPGVLTCPLMNSVLGASSGCGCVSELFFSLLPTQSLCDFCNLIFGAPLKIFKPFAMTAVPQQLLFSCEWAVAVMSRLGFDLCCHWGCRASFGLLHGPGMSLKERCPAGAGGCALHLQHCFLVLILHPRTAASLSQGVLRGRGCSVLPCLRSSAFSSPDLFIYLFAPGMRYPSPA